ncbi:MAG: family 78 glycoside hydrolase catalytic domain, partial [Alistipes ihumii]
MKINRIASGLLLTVALAVVSCGTERSDGGKLAKETEAVGLRCRNLIDPEGVDKASLSWRIASDARNVVQTAWQVEIASSKKSLEKGRADVWNSEKQLSDRQLNIVPEGVVFEPGKLYWWRVRVWNAADEVTPWSEPARFSVGPDTAYRWQAEWITSEWGENSPMPYLRKEFDASNSGTKPERAVVYMSGLGCGDLYLNGRLVDETRVLDPAQTNYEQYAFYSTFDVTDLLEKGDNCIGVMLGDGWYNQDKVWSAGMSYGKPMLLLQMEITYKDGSKRIVATDSTWTWAPGPVLSANLYAGESYDANREIAGWASPGTPSGDWKSVRPAEGVIPARLVPQVMEPIRLKQEIAPVAMWQDSVGNWIFDFGVNVAAVPRLAVEQPQGTRLRMRMGERLDDNRRAIDYRTTGVGATGVVQT